MGSNPLREVHCEGSLRLQPWWRNHNTIQLHSIVVLGDYHECVIIGILPNHESSLSSDVKSFENQNVIT